MGAAAPNWTADRIEAARSVTLLELVRAVAEVTSEEREVVATVQHLLRTGRVTLRGAFSDCPFDV